VDSSTFIKSLAAGGLTTNTIVRVYFKYKSILLHALDGVLHQHPNVIGETAASGRNASGSRPTPRTSRDKPRVVGGR
jgi:hypothetical protein